MNISTDDIAAILGCPHENVSLHWPLIDSSIKSINTKYNDDVAIAVLATIRVEVPPFKPIREYGTSQYFVEHYWENFRVRTMLGNLSDLDAVKYCGRGWPQLTGRANYQKYGDLIGVNLIDHPEQALEPNTAAAIYAAYLHETKFIDAAVARNWVRVREIVNGGHNDLDLFLSYVHKLQGAIEPYVAPDVTGEVSM